MCSCSGSCNCNSTTIPKGPKGSPGVNGTSATIAVGNVISLPVGDAPTVTNSGNSSDAVFNFGIPTGATGAPGENGDPGTPGLNAFTTLTEGFPQPNINGNIEISVVNNSWAAVNQIIYITNGGFYKVIDKTDTTIIELQRLSWTIPGVTFASNGVQVGNVGTIVTPSGTIGPSVSGTNVVGAKWGNFTGSGGTNDFKTSIAVPINTLISDEDILECQTIFRVTATQDEVYFFIKVSPTDTTTGSAAVGISIDLPIVPPYTEARIHVNSKIQKTSSTTFRSKAEIFISYSTSGSGNLSIITNYSSIWSTTSDVLLASSSNWGQSQYIVAGANDSISPSISVINHEVKVFKK